MKNRIQQALIDHGDCIAETASLRQKLTLLELELDAAYLELKKVAGEAYQVIGALASASGIFELKVVQDALDYFGDYASDGEPVRNGAPTTILPFCVDVDTKLTLLEASHESLLAAAKVAVHDESITMRSAMMLGDAINRAEAIT